MIAEILGPDGKVHYRRPENDPMVEEARRTPGYSVRLVAESPVLTELEIAALCGGRNAAKRLRSS